jgi:putative ABC transport system permease protein
MRAVAHAAVFAITVLTFVLLGSYQRALQQDYGLWTNNQLIVQESNSIAEYTGSRISTEVSGLLEQLGVREAIPEVHAIVGTSVQDAVLLKGLDLERYTDVDSFKLLSGRALQPGDPPRRAMIGIRLAERTGVDIGEEISLRGRDFEVIGIFETGSYTENEAWVPIAGAQELLGWDQDVSLYVVVDDGNLTPGQKIREGVSVVRRGESWPGHSDSWSSLLSLMRAVTFGIGMAAALSLSTMLWRMSWQRRWQFAILRSLGFNRTTFVYYVAIQGILVVAIGGFVGIFGAVAIMRLAHVNLGGLSLQPHLGVQELFSSAVWMAVLTLISIAIPVSMLGRKQLNELLVTY